MPLEYFAEARALFDAIARDEKLGDFLTKTIDATKKALRDGHKILVVGNGGSAAEAQHFAAEFVCRYKLDRKGIPAIALTTDTSALTAWGNDTDFNGVFERELEALGNSGDILFGLSTSGNSKNVIRAFARAKEMGIATVALLGKDGGAMKGMAEVEYIVPSKNTPRIQEVHLCVLHSIAEEVEKTA